MDFVSIRVITEDTRRLVAFYEQVTGLAATWYTEDFAEVTTPSCTLAIGHRRRRNRAVARRAVGKRVGEFVEPW